jgi:hypothetical protein
VGLKKDGFEKRWGFEKRVGLKKDEFEKRGFEKR